MGRHAGPTQQPSGPAASELLGWGAFTFVLVVGALLWFGVPWPVVVGVGATVLAGLGAVVAAMTLAPRRRSGRAPGSASRPDDERRVP